MSKYFRRSITRQLVVGISGAVAALLIIASYIILDRVGDNTRLQLESSIKQLVKLQSSQVKGFFEAKGQVVHSVFANPQVIDWFTHYDERLSDISSNEQYLDVTEYFKYFSDNDSAIKSVFFGSANTFEYFDLQGRYNSADYYTNKRPWWQEAQDIGKLFVTDPSVDLNDGSVSATVKSPYYLPNGKLLGIGGIDILITTIGSDLLAKIKYQDEGDAFLMSNNGKLIFLPGFGDQLQPGDMMAKVDQVFQHAEGFGQLQDQIKQNTKGMAKVTWKDEQHLVMFDEVSSDYPHMRWKLGFMVPERLIREPVESAFWGASLTTLVILALIALTVWWMVTRFMKRIIRLNNMMRDIAEGEGDLTKRITKLQDDEIGDLVDHFNLFIDKIQALVKETIAITHHVSDSSQVASTSSSETYDIVEEQKQQIDLVATAANEMAQTSKEMANSAEHAKDYASKAGSQAEEGAKVVNLASEGIDRLSNEINSATDVVKKLRENSESIGEVLNVIRAIAEQTNLLALNAAIEAARAGEQGRGFAVVADEVRTLASRTQDSTANIQSIIEELQQSASTAESVMESSSAEANKSVELNSRVQEVLNEVTQAFSVIQDQAEEIVNGVSQQANVAEDVSRNIENVRMLSDTTVEGTGKMINSLAGLSDNAKQLNQVVNQFKI